MKTRWTQQLGYAYYGAFFKETYGSYFHWRVYNQALSIDDYQQANADAVSTYSMGGEL